MESSYFTGGYKQKKSELELKVAHLKINQK
jgi:hypothetical protein